jgi:hypothetical protein
METIKLNPKSELLLGAGLHVLHFESLEWLETIAFWKDELRFFENLLKRKEIKNQNKETYLKMLKELDKIHINLFGGMEDSIMKHERLLSRIESGVKGLPDAYYREEHRQFKRRMDMFTSDYRSFKKIVFDYVKTL